MTNFEKIISELTIEKVAKLIIDRYNYDNTINNYYTDNGKHHFYGDALKAEIEWLKEEIEM